MELLRINYESEQPTVSARELHEGLEIKTAFKDWFPRMAAYGFEENQDFILVAQKEQPIIQESNNNLQRLSNLHRHGKADLHDSAY